MLLKKLIGLTLCFLVSISGLYAQEVKVLSKRDRKGIGDVNIINQTGDESAYTNKAGKASLADFGSQDTLLFKHASFFKKVVPYETIVGSNFEVILEKKTTNLEEVVFSGNRWEQNRAEVPNKVEPITESEIEFDNPQTSADLLDASNEVFVQKSQLGGGSPMIRGFATKSVLLTVDGVRMNNAIFRGGNLQNVINLDPNAMERTEVVFGPGSVIYGSDALGGVMAFHTKDPELSKTGNFRFDGNAMTRYATANDEKTGHIDLNLGTEKWGFLTSFTYSAFGDQQMGVNGPDEYKRTEQVKRINGRDSIVLNPDPNTQVPSGFDEWFLMQKIRFKPNENWDLNYGFHYSRTSNIPRYDRLTQRKPQLNGPLANATWYYGPQIWMMNNLKIHHSMETTFYDEAKLTIAQQFYEESRHDREFRDPLLRHREENVDIYTANLDFQKAFSENTRLFYGLQGVYNLVSSEAEEENIETGKTKPTATRYPDGSDYQTYAGYARLVHNFSDQWTVNAGARYTHVALNADLTDNQSFYPLPFNKIDLQTGAVNGNLGLIFKPGQSWRFKLNASSGFRAPNIDDVGKVFDSEPGSVVVPNDNLAPEYAYNGDFGIVKQFDDRGRLELTGFYTIVTNSMVRRPLSFNGRDSIEYDGEQSETLAVQNATGSTIYGGSIAFNTPITDHIRARLKYTYIEGETDAGEPIRHVAPPFGAGHLIYENSGLRLNFSARFNQEINNGNLAPSEQDKLHMYALNGQQQPYSPGWYTLNFRAGYELTNFLKVNAGVENILDKRYRSYSSGISAPGRNFYLTLRGQF